MSVRAPRAASTQRGGERLEHRLAIESDGTIVVRSGKVEYGQGIRTGFARIVAEQLAVPLDRVRVELGETDRVPWDMGTFGSLSTATDGAILHAAAVQAKRLLLRRAAAALKVPASQLRLEAGRIVAHDGRAVSYADLVRTRALRGRITGTAAWAPPNAADDEPRRIEALAIVTGAARFPADVRLPGLLHGRVLRAPATGSHLLEIDEAAARAVAGVVGVVRGADWIGVVAARAGQASAALKALAARWGESAPPTPAPTQQLRLRADDGVATALAGGDLRLTREYRVPHIAHAAILPAAAVADVRDDGVDLYVATQRPFGVRDEVAALLGLAPARVHVHPQAMSGSFGRGNVTDAALDAARLSAAVQRPVLVQWTRGEEFAHAPCRPRLDVRIDAALDAHGAIAAWQAHIRTNPHTYGAAALPAAIVAMTSGRNAIPDYRLGCADIALEVVPGAVRTGAFRSLAAAPNVFAIESFVDELAHAGGRDPLQFRLDLAADPRLRNVLECVRRESGWDARPREKGRGFGVACAIYHGTCVAQVAEVAVDDDGAIRLERVWCAVDAGRLVHPDGARNQIEGGIQQAASWTLLERLAIDEGRVGATTWRDYPIATCRDAPRSIEVFFTGDTTRAPTGVGEPGSVPTAAAIANALFAASGRRERELPLHAGAARVPAWPVDQNT